MGMYTGVRCKVIIKPEYRDEIERLSKDHYNWADSKIDFMKEYGQDYRATFIPLGALAYMPNSWEIDGRATDDFERSFNKEIGLWTFQCSLKNYEHTIEHFFEDVLAKIAQEIIHLEYYYEEWISSWMYDLKGNKIVRSGIGIKYNFYEEEDIY